MKIKFKNSKDYNRAIELLNLANIRVGEEDQQREAETVTIGITHSYYYICPHCEKEYIEMASEFEVHYNQETGLIQCHCGKELKPMIKHGETVIPQVLKTTETEENIFRLSFNREDYDRIHDLLRISGIEVSDLNPIEPVKVYVDHAYEFYCPNCGEYHQYNADCGRDLYEEYNPQENFVKCNYCEEKFNVRFKNEQVIFE